MSQEQAGTFRALLAQGLQVARASLLKEHFRAFCEYTRLRAARTFFRRWFWRATHSRLRHVVQVAKLIDRHLPNLLTYLTYIQHGVTNAALEA
jgi:transposase